MPAAKNKNTTKKNIIGVFDSGLGGLTVLKHFLQELPGYNYIYLGDTARLPYGEKSPETIYAYSREAMDYLFRAGCNLVIIACNTASSRALRRLQQEYLPENYPDRRILGVIRPIAEYVAQNRELDRVGVIGTKATINSDAYRIEITKLRPEVIVEQMSTSLLVPLIEEGWADQPETQMILKKYLQPLQEKKIKALILGCTHYPFLQTTIKKIMGDTIALPRTGEIIVLSLKDYLSRHPESGLTPVAAPLCRYFTTDNTRSFQLLAEKFLEQKIANLALARITEA